MNQFTGANELLNGLAGEFDAHVHVFHRKLPMLDTRRYTPVRDALLAELSEHLLGHNLSGGFLVQPSFLGTDNRFLLETLQQTRVNTDLMFRGVVVVDPLMTLPELKKYSDAGVIGMRLNLLSREREFHYADWKPLLMKVEKLGWHVELQCAGASLNNILKDLLKTNSKIVIDHFGLPDQALPLESEGFKAILKMQSRGVYVKLSAPYRVFPQLDESEAVKRCQPLVKALVDSLGANHLLWGSDWPWTQHESKRNYTQSINWLRYWNSINR